MQRLSHTKDDGSKKTIQSKLSDKNIKDKLIGYDSLPLNKIKNILPGDDIRYMSNNKFRCGGRVKANNYPNYIVLLNVYKKVSWCVQLSDPTLKIWIRNKDRRVQEKANEDIAKDKEILKLRKELQQLKRKK